MNSTGFSRIITAFVLVGFPTFALAQRTSASYFDLGLHLVEEFRGTYEFNYKRIEFTKTNNGYLIHSSGDESPSTDTLRDYSGTIEWVLGWSGEKWILLNANLYPGEHWHHLLRGWNQEYRVASVNETLVLPAGTFHSCAKIEITWTAHEHDMEGPQKVVLYLAPSLGIVKREEWSNGDKWHEEVLTKFSRAK